LYRSFLYCETKEMHAVTDIYSKYGTWQVYIVTTRTVSTATARMTVDYTY